MLNERLGKHTLSLGSSRFLDRHRQIASDERPARKSARLPGKTCRQHLTFPRRVVDM